MSHPTTRVLTLLELLQSRSQLSGGELATRLEVDRRTVRRYVTSLQDLGVPVESESGRYGGYRLRPGYKLPPMMFTEEETLSLILGLILSKRIGLGDTASSVEGALAKIDRVLPDRLRGRVQAVQGALAFTPFRGSDSVTDPAMLLGFTTAAQETRRVWMRYRGPNGVSERELDPYGVVHHRGRWYVVGWCHLRQDVRLFRMDRVLALESRREVFARPLDFDCVQEVMRSLATLPYGLPVEVLLDVRLEDAQRRIAADLGTLAETHDGVIFRTQVDVDAMDWMSRFLIQLGCGFRILSPPELRQAVLELARSVSRQARRAPRPPARRARRTAAPGAPRTPAPSPPAPGAAVGRTQ